MMEKSSFNPSSKDNNNDQLSRTKTRSQNLLVFIRVRPFLKGEFGKDAAITCHGNVSNMLI